MPTGDLLDRARAGDGEAFQALTEPYRRELQVHCYRMLGSIHDAQDALQDSLLSAWRGLPGFEQHASLRTWLYRIATNRCLNVRRAAVRRRAGELVVAGIEAPEPTGLGQVTWLEPFPDALLEGATDNLPGPEARYEQTESISLAFITALQLLPPRQLATLILRDVLGFRTQEVAQMLEASTDAVESTLKRARTAVQRRRPIIGDPPPTPASAAEEAVTARFVSAYEAADLEALLDLLTDDAFMSMPPIPLEYEGRDAVAGFCAAVFDTGRRFELVQTRANGQPAFGAYLRSPDGPRPGTGLFVLTLRGEQISALTRFESGILPWFDLPPSLHPIRGTATF
jgi:RNA polymerase sigma-70 factor (TIGR02960 family)